jgi:hypothetical protein
MSATWLGVKLALVAGMATVEHLFARQEPKASHPVTKELKESIQAFKEMGAEIELQPILNYLASIELRECGSGNIPAVRRQEMKTGIDYQANCAAHRLVSRSAANASRFLRPSPPPSNIPAVALTSVTMK